MNGVPESAPWAFQQSSTFSTQATDFGRRRLRILFGIGAVCSGFFWLFRAFIVVAGLSTGQYENVTLLHPSLLSHLSGVIPMAVGWVALRRQQTATALTAIEGTCLLASCTAFLVMAGTEFDGLISEIVTVLIFTYLYVLRAAFVPSTAERTAVLTGSMAIGLAALSIYGRTGLGESVPTVAVNTSFLMVWWGITTVSATTVSHVIWGLRTEVREARRIGRYTLEDKLGEGGMGVVYRASHARLRRPVAIKMLKSEGLSSDDALRFEREAQITANLQSPNTIQLFDFGQAPDGQFYYAMELLDGDDLQRFVERFGPLRPERAVHWLVQACRSLAEAHDAQLVHRDIKPSNLYVCRRGLERDVIKVLDFGLVKPTGTLGGSDPAVTAAGVIRGTPAYMAPESATTGEVDQRSDIYALGCVGWFLLAGREPFEADSPIEVIMKHLQDPVVPPSAVSEQAVPPGLDDLIVACMAKRPSDRPATVEAVRARLQAIDFAEPWDDERASAWWSTHLPA